MPRSEKTPGTWLPLEWGCLGSGGMSVRMPAASTETVSPQVWPGTVELARRQAGRGSRKRWGLLSHVVRGAMWDGQFCRSC